MNEVVGCSKLERTLIRRRCNQTEPWRTMRSGISRVVGGEECNRCRGVKLWGSKDAVVVRDY